MSPDQFNKAWKKLGKSPVKAEVLKQVLDGQTNAEIARLRGRAEGTIRKQISKIYEDFGIKSEFPGDSTQRDQLKDLFRKHEHEWVTNYPSVITNEVSNEQKHLNHDSSPSIDSSSVKRRGSFIDSAVRILNQIDFSTLPSSSTSVVDEDEDLMSLAIRLLDELGFNQKFKVTKGFGYTGYRFKNPKNQVNHYQLILFQQQESLSVSIPQYILEPYLLTLVKYWTRSATPLEELEASILGRFLVLPLKKDIFLDSLHPNYWNILEVERKTIGTCFLNEIVKFCDEVDGEVYCYGSNSIFLQEFNPNTISDSNSYLIVGEDERFSYTWQICISSSEILQEFIENFGKIVFLDDGTPDADDVPF